MPRAYDNSRRAAAAADTRARIAAATEGLFLTVHPDAITLQSIADAAGVTVQTVLRHLGSREGCFAAAAERVRARIDTQRAASAPGDVAGALAGLLDHYEAEGRLVLRLLALEGGGGFAREAAETGRAYHRAWVERCFGPRLPAGRDREQRVDALVAATDLYVWKLLRLDLGRPPESVAATVSHLVHAVLEVPP